MPSTPRTASLEALRVLGVVGVVAIHVTSTHPGDWQAFVLNELGRFAVPMFFMLSAYFWRPEDIAHPGRLALRVARRILPAFVIWAVIYAAVRAWQRPDDPLRFDPQSLFNYLWTGGNPDLHLWFLPALVIGTAIVAGLAPRVGWRITAFLAAIAYLAGALLGVYGPLLGLDLPYAAYRNGLLFAPACLVVGYWLGQTRDTRPRLPIPALALAVTLSALLHIAEGRIAGGPLIGHDYGLATILYALAMLLFFERLPLKGRFWLTLGAASFGAYLIHPLLLNFGEPLLARLPMAPSIVATAALSVALTAAYRAIHARVRRDVA